MLTRLDPPIWVMTPLGEADAEFLIDRGPEYHLQWVCWLHDTGECWTFRNPEVRRATNVTISTIATNRKPPTYGDLWDDYAAGRLSTSAMRRLLESDEVFRRWCVKRAAIEREARDRQAAEDDGA